MASLLRRWFLNLIVAVIVALLGAIPLSNASGFAPQGPTAFHFNDHPGNSPLVWTCGAILFFLTLAVMGPITRAIGTLVARLGQTEARPTPGAAKTMIGCGTLCVVSSLYLAWMSSTSSPINQIKGQLQEMMNSVNANGVKLNLSLPGEAFDGSSGSGAMILTVFVFALGLGLIALGVWATLPASLQSRAPIKTPIPAADATSL
jgi:hypothetical protein